MYREIISKYQPNRSYLPSIVFILACTFLLALLRPQEPGQLGRNVTFTPASEMGPDPEALARSHPSDFKSRVRRLPQAIIIGARKCGTRALLRFLELNPNVKSASKEVHFFDRDENYEKGLDWYRSQMPETDVGQITLEKSPAYFVTKSAPSRVKAMEPKIKLIVILRDPVIRLISDYSQLIANRIETRSDADQLATNRSQNSMQDLENDKVQENIWRKAELDLKRHILTTDGRIDESRRLIRTGMYSVHLEKWLALFPRHQFHFVNGERLIAQPHFELQKLESFLGIEPTIRSEQFVFIAQKGFFCISGSNVTASREESESEKPFRKPICLSKSKGRRHIAVDHDLRNNLQDFYAPFNEYLSSLTGIDFK